MHAEVAHAALGNNPSASDAAFYQGKVATSAFFAKNMLPKLTAVRRVIEAIDDDVTYVVIKLTEEMSFIDA